MPGNFNSISASDIASWPTPNYVDPVRRTWMPAFAITWQAASTILVVARFYLRAKRQAGSFGLDDLFIFFGWVFSIAFTITAWLGAASFDLDRHTWDVHPSVYQGTALNGWVAQIMFVLSTVPTKCSVLLFYRRMVKDAMDRRWLYAIYAALFVTASYGLAIFITYFLTCQPLDALWKSYDPTYTTPYKCINGDAFTITVGVCSVLSDIYAVLLPCLILRHYQLDVPRKQKIALNFIFALGFLVAGAGIGRTYYLWQVNNAADTSWNGFDLFAWSDVECQLAIICACTPSLRAFFRQYLRDPLKRTFDTTSSVSYYGAANKPGHTIQSASSTRRGVMETETRDRERTESRESLRWDEDLEDGEIPVGMRVGVRERAGMSEDGMRITSPEEYEMYAVEKLRRHESVMSKCTLELDMVREKKDKDRRRRTVGSEIATAV